MGKFLINAGLSVALIVTCAFLSWHALSKVNFYFTHIYEYNELEKHIEEYAPQNRNRNNFEHTTKAERVKIFSEIVAAINNNGSGLSDIYYRGRSGQKIDTFLTPPELNHLVDVSDLVSSFNKIGILVSSFLVMFYLLCYVYKLKKGVRLWKPFSVAVAIANMCVLVLLLGLSVFLVGPRDVFHGLHELLFADKGQWYFYYEESLMTTLLPEPVFGTISLLLLAATLAFWIVFTSLIRKILK